MTQNSLRTFATGTAMIALLVSVPTPAYAQSPAAAPPARVRIDATLVGDIGREIRDALREVTSGIGEVLRDVSRDLGRELGSLDRGTFNAQERGWAGQAEDRQTRSLAIGASGSLEIRNLSGHVTVTAGSGRDASVELIRRARGRTDADARLGLERVKVDTQVTGSRGAIRSEYPNDRQASYSVSIEMIVSAPAGTRLLVNSVSGGVDVRGIKGELSVTTISGDIAINNVGPVT